MNLEANFDKIDRQHIRAIEMSVIAQEWFCRRAENDRAVHGELGPVARTSHQAKRRIEQAHRATLMRANRGQGIELAAISPRDDDRENSRNIHVYRTIGRLKRRKLRELQAQVACGIESIRANLEQ